MFPRPHFIALVVLFWFPSSSFAGTLFWTAVADSVHRADLNGDNQQALVATQGGSFGIAVDNAAGRIYWSDEPTFLQGRIQSANLDGTMITPILTQGLGHVFGIAVDAAAGKIYWASNISHGVHRANLDGSNKEKIVDSSGAIHLALDPQAGKVYWTDADARMILRVNFDGTSIDTLFTDVDLGFGGALALDLIQGHLYWGENSQNGRIRRADLDGSAAMDVVSGLDLGLGVGLALNPECDTLFWTERATGRLMRLTLSGAQPQMILDGLVQPTGIATTPDCFVDVEEHNWSRIKELYR